MNPESIEDELRRRMEPDAEGERRKGFLAIAAGVLLMAGIGAFFYFRFAQQQVRQVRTQVARISLEKDDGGALTSISRSDSPEVWYRVTLADAPVGRTLRLGCRWTNPAGEVVHENSWETKTITVATWETHCRTRFGPASITGNWLVEMKLEDSQISETPFEVR